ncbi:MAG: hypothetical protein WCT46_03720 [Candidatus Gracilibacteria bacterium]
MSLGNIECSVGHLNSQVLPSVKLQCSCVDGVPNVLVDDNGQKVVIDSVAHILTDNGLLLMDSRMEFVVVSVNRDRDGGCDCVAHVFVCTDDGMKFIEFPFYISRFRVFTSSPRGESGFILFLL